MPDRLLPKLLTLTTAAILAGRSVRALRQALDAKELAHVKSFGTMISVPTAELERSCGREITREQYLQTERAQDAARERAAGRAVERRAAVG